MDVRPRLASEALLGPAILLAAVHAVVIILVLAGIL